MSDFQKPLIANDRGNQAKRQFQKQYQGCEIRYKRIKQKNDLIQKTSDNDLDKDIVKQIKSQGEFIEKETTELSKKLAELKKVHRDPGYQLRIKKLQANLGDQITRNKQIMTNYINRVSTASFIKRRNASSVLDQGSEGETFVAIRPIRDSSNNRDSRNLVQQRHSRSENQNGNLVEVERQINKEKGEALRELEVRMNRVNDIMNGMAIEVHQQGEFVDVIGENMNNAKEAVQGANSELESAQNFQKKSKKKYVFLLLMIVLVAGTIAGLAILLF